VEAIPRGCTKKNRSAEAFIFQSLHLQGLLQSGCSDRKINNNKVVSISARPALKKRLLLLHLNTMVKNKISFFFYIDCLAALLHARPKASRAVQFKAIHYFLGVG
jgi:hypothetical protein